jgi:O-antigen/teichoic acid export membrane protein
MIQRILKMFGALGAGIGIALVTQFLLPPAFLHCYGVKKYGEWLVLASAVSYLGTLNFGITTYASNQLTILRKRGEMDRYRELQGSTLALLLCMICIGMAIVSAAMFLPLSRLLHLSTVGATGTRLVVFFFGLQVMAHILGGYYNNLFMVLDETHRGTNWANARYLAPTLVSLPLAMLGVQFSGIAIGQFAAAAAIAMLTICDLKRRMGGLPLGLGGWNWTTVKSTLAPSGMFAMIFTQSFLVYQAPIILLQWIVGPESVVFFSICRTVFSTARQALQPLTSAIAPEITYSFADRDMKKLLSIFHYSEKVVFAGIPVANLGAFLFSPVLLNVWLRRPLLFDPFTYSLMALVSGAMSMRDHKQYFQFSTNTHKRLSIIVFFGNVAMLVGSVPMTIRFGLHGFMFTWLISELAQMGLIYRENKKLFDNDPSISIVPVLRLGLVTLVSLPICAAMVIYARQRSLLLVGVVATLGMLLLVAESYLVFGLKDVWDEFRRRTRRAA